MRPPRSLAHPAPAGGAELIRTWTFGHPGAPGNFFEIDAFLRGPDLAPIESQLADLVTSLRYDPPVPPTSSGAGAVAPQSTGALIPANVRFAGKIGCANFPYGCTATLSVLDPSTVVPTDWRPPASDPWWAPDWSQGTQSDHFDSTPVTAVPGLIAGRHQLVVTLLGSYDVTSFNPDGSRAFDLVGRCSTELDIPATAASVSILVTFVSNGENFQTACSLEATTT